jgi:PKD repeat protein
LRAKVWPAATAEPATWLVTGTDSTAGLQSAGQTGFVSFLSGSGTNAPVTTSFDSLNVRPSGAAPANQQPVAAFTSSAVNLAASFDGSASTDPDGTVVSCGWNFGDGTPVSTGVAVNHAYAVAGTYQVTLTVTDNLGATGSVTKSVTVAANVPPVASFTSSAANLAASFDGSASSDPDGTVASYSWDFGDGSAAGIVAKPSHTYAGSGTYTVTLTVKDNQGATGVLTKSVTVAANLPPVASFTSSAVNLAASFDGSASADPDGTIASYSWDFGDGSAPGSGPTPSHLYGAAGTYTVVLTVTDNQGGTGSSTTAVTVTAGVNQLPVASFTSSSANLVASFNGSASADPDGTIASYSWDFGDGSAPGSGPAPSHTYAAAGTYQVVLTVTDNQGGTGSSTKSVTVAVNQPPVASFTSSAVNLAASFDGSASSDTDGNVASYSWNFGDGSAAGVGATPSHVYAGSGTYQVTLTVTDNQGATGFVTNPVTVAANQPPVASFTSSAVNLATSFNGSASTDTDGTVASYSWNFGDGSAAGVGATPSHSYAAVGTYQVTLTVTDNQGATGFVTNPVTVVLTPFVVDTFARTLASGWGSADTGGAWTGTTSALSVGGGTAAIKVATAGSAPSVYLNATTSTDADLSATMSSDKVGTGNGVYLFTVGRRVSGAGDYRVQTRLRSDGLVGVSILRTDSAGVQTVVTAEVTVAGYHFVAGDKLNVRFQVTGTTPTTVRAKVWPAALSEPATWLASGTDTTAALQVPGAAGFIAYLSGTGTNAPVTTTFSNLNIRPTH